MIYPSLCDHLALQRQATEYLRDVARKRLMQDASPSGKGSSGLYVTATNGAYPSNPASVFVVTPLEADCDDTEGASASYSQDTQQNAFAVNLGSQVPPQGTEIICSSVGGRLVFRYDG